MNDLDLKARLKSIPLPRRPDKYWEDFPSQVRRQLNRAAPELESRENRLSQFAWKMGIGFACLIIGLFVFNQPLKAATCDLVKNERIIRQQLTQLPGHLRVLMADEHGLHYLVAEKE